MRKFSATIEGIDNGFIFSAGLIGESDPLVRAFCFDDLDVQTTFERAWRLANEKVNGPSVELTPVDLPF